MNRSIFFLAFFIAMAPCWAYGQDIVDDISKSQFDHEKCYIEISVNSPIGIDSDTIYIYKGNDPDILSNYVVDVLQITHPPGYKFVKKKANKNCLSNDPEDCLVWCRVETPALYRTISNVLMDTVVTKDYAIRTKLKTIENTETQTVAVVCANLITPDLLHKVQVALSEEGYDVDAELQTRVWDSISKNKLRLFQSDLGLIQGGLTEEVMEHLGVSY